MRKNGIAATVLVILILAAVTFFASKGRAGYTRDDLTVISQADDHVMVSYEGRTVKLYKHFSFDFDFPDFLGWFDEGEWTGMTLQSPLAKTVADYVALRKEIRAGRSDFLDNRIEAVGGAARFTSVDPATDMVTAKAMLQNDGLWFVKGDDLWFKGQFFLETGIPFTIVDFQERGRRHSPGPRITIWERTHIGMEMKHGFKPTMRQTIAEVPTQRWFDLKVHMVLDEKNGHIRIWQDGVLIIDGPVRTLPKSNSVLNALEVGITATSQAATVLVDDVFISHEPL